MSTPSSSSSPDLPLPKGWNKGFSKSQNRPFYFHAATKVNQWHFPTASEAKDPAKAKQRVEMNKEREEQKQKRKLEETNDKSSSNSSSTPNNINKRPNTLIPDKPDDSFLELADTTCVAIIVPFRDIHVEQQRRSHLQQFIPHMHSFLNQLKQDGKLSNFHIYIIEQSDDQRKFNRGKLLNIGFDLARKSQRKHDVFIFHDVDLLPQEDLRRWYSTFPAKPLHIARVWKRYSNNPKYFGGVVSFSGSDYKRINGYPNTFWGWGGEDDEMQRRLERLGIQFDAPDKGTLVDLEQMSLTEKLDFLRQHKSWKCMVKWEAAEEHENTWKTNGLADLKYQVLETKPLNADTKTATLYTVDVKLNGSHWSNDKAGIDWVG
jgi:hypothetical protein